MLADEIMESGLLRMFVEDHQKKVAQKIVVAQKFSFEGRTVQAAAAISDRKPSNLLECMSWARLPFDQTWIEFPWPVRRFSDPKKKTGRHITKVGLLFEATPNSDARVIDIFYKGSDGSVGHCVYHLLYDWTGRYGLRAEQAKLYRKSALELSAETAQQAAENPDVPDEEQDAYVRLYLDVFGVHLSPLTDPQKHGWDKLTKEEIIDGAVTDRCTALYCTSLSLAFILLLNCRSGVIIDGADTSKINKHRIQRKFRPYFEHKTVTLEIFKIKTIRRADGNRAESRAHWVMGHFKRRSTGVFWWAPHVRGDSSIGWIEKDYEVA